MYAAISHARRGSDVCTQSAIHSTVYAFYFRPVCMCVPLLIAHFGIRKNKKKKKKKWEKISIMIPELDEQSPQCAEK